VLRSKKYLKNKNKIVDAILLNSRESSEIWAWGSDIAPDADVTDCCEQTRKSETNAVEQNLENQKVFIALDL